MTNRALLLLFADMPLVHEYPPGGNGGGRPDSAMGGAGDPEKIAEALTRLPELI